MLWYSHLFRNFPQFVVTHTVKAFTVVSEADVLGLNDQDNQNGVLTHLEPDIVECEVKRALESITMNKASRGDANPTELFKMLTDDDVKALLSPCQQVWNTQQWPQDWKRSVFIPTPKKGKSLLKNVLTTT